MAILSEQELRDALAAHRDWRRQGDALVRERAFRDFAEALGYVARIGDAVHDWGRHPDVAITNGNRVRVSVANANGAGFTDAELRLLAKVDELADAPSTTTEPEHDGEEDRGTLAAVASSVGSTVAQPKEAVGDLAEPAPVRGGRVAVVAAAVGGMAVGAAAAVAALRR